MSRFDEAVTALAAQYGITAPLEQVEAEVSALEQEFCCRMRYESLASGVIPVSVKPDHDELHTQAVQSVLTRLVLEHVISAEKLTVTREELEEEAQAIARRQDMPIETVRGFLGPDFHLLQRDLLEQKAMDLITGSLIRV